MKRKGKSSIFQFPDRVMEVKTILIILVLNIALPTLDTVTDINLVLKLYRKAHFCASDDLDSANHDYRKCNKDPVSFCSNNENNQSVCRFSTHPKMATAMLTPFLLNYFVCVITFLRKEKNKKFTLIFALLNLYPQLGKNNH